jgi:GNAT superfamily N-acetyltransferase
MSAAAAYRFCRRRLVGNTSPVLDDSVNLQVGGRDPELSARLSDELDAVNLAATGADDQAGLTVKVTNAEGDLIAGLAGWTWGGCAGIEMVWVHAAHRKDGWGSRLIAAAEAEVRRRGCTEVSVTSFTFQAPGFYQRLGYVVTGQRLGIPGGAADMIMWKSLVDAKPVELVAVLDYDDRGRSFADTFAGLVTRHRGRTERRLTGGAGNAGTADVFLIWFPDRDAYDAFCVDPDTDADRAGVRATTRVFGS